MEAPKDFVEKLEREFPDLRIRWSHKRQAWHVEQRVGRAALDPIRIDPDDDRLITARDGYWFVLEVKPAQEVDCPGGCGAKLKVPELTWKEVKCLRCELWGKDPFYMMGYFPLGEALLDHLRYTDPRRGAIKELAKKADEANQKLLDQRKRDLHNEIEAATKDSFNKVFGIPQVGYTGSSKVIHLEKGVK